MTTVKANHKCREEEEDGAVLVLVWLRPRKSSQAFYDPFVSLRALYDMSQALQLWPVGTQAVSIPTYTGICMRKYNRFFTRMRYSGEKFLLEKYPRVEDISKALKSDSNHLLV